MLNVNQIFWRIFFYNSADIEKYNDSRYLVARTVAETFFQQIVDNCDTKLEELVKYLNDEKCTIVGEILQPKYQHIENLSHLESPQIQYVLCV